ncbi:MAG: TRAP transporter TatT component family protein [Candidatus Aminicenantes bacterium]|nr:TRAP transporter TatT component family protein [Candidatus Aminicenantes bacterium]
MKNPFFSIALLLLPGLLFSPACSIKKFAMNQVANALTGPSSSTVFSGDDDPELVGDALPFAIKMYESLMVANPGHLGLKLKTGSLYIMYANAFLQSPALMLPASEFKLQEFNYQRAKKLYLRGRDIILSALEHKYPGFKQNLQKKLYAQTLAATDKKDVPLLYWAGAGWLGAYAIDPFDMDLGMTLPAAAALMNRVLELEADYSGGAIHEFYILYYGSLPDYMGGSLQKAREHFEKAIAISAGKSATPYISLATTVAVKEQNLEEFRSLLKQALAIDPDNDPENRLVNILNQRKALWLSEHADDFFLDAEPANSGNKE